MDHRNRDYFAKPIQRDRNCYDYGNTKLTHEPEFSIKHNIKGFLLCIGITLCLYFFAIMGA